MAKKRTNLDGLKVLLAVTGGIAAYKAVDLASKLTAGGAEVVTVMTKNACRFIRPKSFEAVTRSAVFTSMWRREQEYKIGHVNLADWADIVVVAPATANIIAKAANGICDDMLSTLLCVCWSTPTLFAPAMNDRMWKNPAVQRNVKFIKQIGFKLIGPETGHLACGTEGLGRMSEPAEIVEAIIGLAKKNSKH